ncbi:hypothetical protein AT6N2_C3375 [Agrobacterium tumefaciens]|nr:hypothetical protein AT6N2_C3375 [Agrobacterium tumefaciens]
MASSARSSRASRNSDLLTSVKKKPVPMRIGAGFFHSGWCHFIVSQAFIMSAFFILFISMPALCMQSFLLVIGIPSFFMVSIFMVSPCMASFVIPPVFMPSAWTLPAKDSAESMEVAAMAIRVRVMKDLLLKSLNVRRQRAAVHDHPFGQDRLLVTSSRACDGKFGRDFFQAIM